MLIEISTLPKTIQEQLPLSIRTFKTEYEFNSLPVRIQHLIKDYQRSLPEISYNIAYDLIPEVSEYSDFKVINNNTDLVVEYLKNYLIVLPGSYPFDPVFGCGLKSHLQTKDTNLRETLITNEVSKIIQIIQSLLSVDIRVDSLKIEPTSMGSYTEFNINIAITVNNNHKNISMQIS